MRLLWLATLGIAFLCLPAVASEEVNQCAHGQLLGHWFVHGIASNCEWMVQFVVKEIMSCNITSPDEGSFTVSTSFMTEYGPMDVNMTYTKQDDGKYLQKSEWGDKILEERKTDCKTYVITYIRDVTENNGKICKLVSLYARTMSVSDSVKQSYIDFAKGLQIDREQIFLLAKKAAATKSD